MSSICGRISSYLPAFTLENFENGLIAGMLVQGCMMGGPLLAIAELGLYLGARKYVLPTPQTELMAPGSHRLDVSTRLFKPSGSPAEIVWRNNSCFCSSPLWSFFTNEPAVLGELPEAIHRRLDERLLFPGGEAAFAALSPEQVATVSEILTILRKRGPFTLADFNTLRLSLKQLEVFGFPKNEDHLKALLSLLEMHDLIREFQTSPSISGDRVNELREMAHRVNPGFRDRGNRVGDAHELAQTLSDLIFDKSRFQQQITTTRTGQGNDIKLTERRPGWGDFLLPMPSSKKSANLQVILNEYLSPADPVKIVFGRNHETFKVIENTQFQTPPPFLSLTLNRGKQNVPFELDFKVAEDIPEWAIPTDDVPDMNMDPIEVPDQLHLRNGQKGDYQLVGVSRRRADINHYDAILKRPDGRWYFCDDRKKPSVSLMNPRDVSQYAQTGYMFFYRRVGI